MATRGMDLFGRDRRRVELQHHLLGRGAGRHARELACASRPQPVKLRRADRQQHALRGRD